MKKFMKTHKVYLTPISPIHIGCGEDFEPTNYVIDKQVLYHFEPSQLNLSESQRQDLMVKSNNCDLLGIQSFFLKHKEQAINSAHYFVNVSKELENNWRNKVGKPAQIEKNKKEVINRLAIERTTYSIYKNEPYIPGSSFKGALATALLNNYHQKNTQQVRITGKDNKQLIKNYLGEFEKSKLRTVKFSDFIAIEPAHTKILYCINFKKEITEKETIGKGRGLTIRRECISQGQYRTFQSELTIWENKDNPLKIKDYLSLLNEYYKPIFEKECEMLFSRGLVKREWISSIMALLAKSSTALIRLGKNGADSKVYQGNIAQIKIIKGKGKKPDTRRSSATTVWLAGEQENQLNNLLPFGWALLEIDQTEDNAVLKEWCSKELKQIELFNKGETLRDLAKRKTELLRQKEIERLAKQAKDEALKITQEEERKRLSKLTLNQLLIEEYFKSIENAEIKHHTSSPVFKEAKKLIETAINEGWNENECIYLFDKTDIKSTDSILRKKVDITERDKAFKEFNKLRNKLK